MKDKDTLFDYIGQVIKNFGICILLMNIFCIIFGKSAKSISNLFTFGEKGLSIATMMQFLLLSIFIVVIQHLFFKDFLIKKLSLAGRLAGLFLSIFAVISVFVLMFGWFPVHDLFCWFMFFVCFVICSLVSVAISTYREKAENRRMEIALNKLKDESKQE